MENLKVYKSRWWIVFIFSVYSAAQSIIWLTFSPIADDAEKFYKVNNTCIALLSAVGPITYILVAPLASWAIDSETLGLRKTILLSCTILVVGTIARCFATDASAVSVSLLFFGQIMNGIAGPVVLGSPAKISQVWFSPHQRGTSTAITTFANVGGACLGFLILPWQVTNWGILNMLRCWAFIIGLISVSILIYFPNSPPTPPSLSSTTTYEPFLQGCMQLLRNKDFFLLALAVGLSSGIFVGLSGILSVVLKSPPWCLNDSTAFHEILNSSAWLGFLMSCSATAGGVVAGPIIDTYNTHIHTYNSHKLLLLVFFLASAVLYLWFVLVAFSYVAGRKATLFLSLIMGTFFLNATTPLGIELAAEVTYPVGTGTSNGVMQLFVNVCCFLFIAMGFYGDLLNHNPLILAYMMPIASTICFMAVLFVGGEKKRMKIDTLKQESSLGVNGGLEEGLTRRLLIPSTSNGGSSASTPE